LVFKEPSSSCSFLSQGFREFEDSYQMGSVGDGSGCRKKKGKVLFALE
jgi:hypothetical protein